MIHDLVEVQWRRPDGNLLLDVKLNTAAIDPRGYFPEPETYMGEAWRLPVVGAYSVYVRRPSRGEEWRQIAEQHDDGTRTWDNSWLRDLL